MHKSSMQAMKEFIDNCLNEDDNLMILDVGSRKCDEGSQTYKDLMKSKKWKYFGLDLSLGLNVDIAVPNPYVYPFVNNHFDVVISGQAFEHSERPWELIQEIYRILKPGGLVCVIAPGGGKKHWKIDCWRILEDGMKALFDYAGFETTEIIRSKKGKWKDCRGIGRKPNDPRITQEHGI